MRPGPGRRQLTLALQLQSKLGVNTNPHPSASSGGFTRTELLVLLATLALLAAVTRPVWGNGTQPRSLLCMDNLRRLSAAWLLYADDSGGDYIGNYHGGFVPAANGRERPWVTGWLDWDIRSDNTNTVYLTQSR